MKAIEFFCVLFFVVFVYSNQIFNGSAWKYGILENETYNFDQMTVGRLEMEWFVNETHVYELHASRKKEVNTIKTQPTDCLCVRHIQ